MEPVVALEYAEHLRRLRARVNEALPRLPLPQEPADLYAPVRYVLDSEGKRFRPLLVLLAAEASGATEDDAFPAALAVEVFHNFTLVHDDIMDQASTRRGRPTVHVRWDVATAVLCGDYLMALSYDLLAQCRADRLPALLRVWHRMVQRLCEGQALDKAMEQQAAVSVEAYLHMVDGKTGALLAACLELGGLLGQASPQDLHRLRAAGEHLGRAFQIQDDLLDLVAPDTRWGKRIGGDLLTGKKTYLLLQALEQAKGGAYDWFARIVQQQGLPEADIPEARSRMEDLGVLDRAREAVAYHTRAAQDQLAGLPAHPARDGLQRLVDRMQARLH
jgi:geranylgeranyl diphosphate synthase type II